MPVGVGSPDNNGHFMDGRIFDLIFLYEIIKSTTVLMMRKLHARNVERNGFELPGLSGHLVEGDVYEFGLFIDKSADKPGTGNAVDLGTFAGNPFHAECSLKFRKLKISISIMLP